MASDPQAPEKPPTPDSAEESRLCELGSYSDLFLRMLDGIFLLDLETYTIRDINDSVERLLKTERQLLLGKPFYSWTAPNTQAELEQNLRISKRKYYPKTWDSRWIIDGKEYIFQISACLLKLSNESEVIQAIARDVTVERHYAKNLEILNKRLEALSQTDEMTQLFNYRYFKNLLEQEHTRSQRYGRQYSIVFLDADQFKHYNDTNGHPAGDQLLRMLSQLIQKNCRTSDYPARYGGEEFAIILPETDSSQAMIFAERLRTSVETTEFPNGQAQPLGKVTISIGIASFPADGKTPEKILEAADNAVYHSKKAGRNRTTRFDSTQG